MEMLNPALSDSAVAVRIASGRIRDPFASDRRVSTRPPTTTTTRPPARRRDPPTRQERHFTDWPEDVIYGGLVSRAGAPGTYSVLFNDQSVQVGEVIPGTR